ncbi:AAA family ATPase [Haloferula chungangensis]|uniref:AAA family ATPase n=1 Tax=Haloferula chungangensis TaxID=1048331 RepID=A0ABW2L5X7_9BACT
MNPPALDAPTQNFAQVRDRIRQELHKVVIGQDEPIDLMLLALLCGGHALLLGVPGVGKTLMTSNLAHVLNLDYRRVQFTPDLMPTDITGSEVLEEDPATRLHNRRFMEGPIFTNFLLADEINRTPPKTQAALLQAMQERIVTIGRETYPLPPPFLVLATQNPIEMEGTYPLPEAQLDRFLFCIKVGYPSEAEEISIVRGTTALAEEKPQVVLGPQDIIAMQKAVRGVPVADDVMKYAVRLVQATRPKKEGEPSAFPDAEKYIEVGASPRASQTLILAAKGIALLSGRVHVDFADIKRIAAPVLRHRLVMNFRSRADKVEVDDLIARLLETIKA